MLDIKYNTIKQFLTDNGIQNQKQYNELWKTRKLPSNFPLGIVSYLKKHDHQNFISMNDLFPNWKSFRYKPIIKVKPIKIKKLPKIYIKKLGIRYTYAEAISIVRNWGISSQREWNQHTKLNKNNWDHRLPKTPYQYYSRTKEWINWKHFLIGNNVPIRMSQGEKEIFRLLTYENIYFEMNKKFHDLGKGKLSFDFFVPSFNLLIEYDGIYHFNKMRRTEEKFQKQLSNDLLKYQYTVDKGFKFKRIAYYEHNYISTILFDLGLLKTKDVKLMRRQRAIPYKNYIYHSHAGNYTYDQVHEVRQLYLSGFKRKDIETKLNIIFNNRYVFSDMVSNKTYFNPQYNPKSKKFLKKIF